MKLEKTKITNVRGFWERLAATFDPAVLPQYRVRVTQRSQPQVAAVAYPSGFGAPSGRLCSCRWCYGKSSRALAIQTRERQRVGFELPRRIMITRRTLAASTKTTT